MLENKIVFELEMLENMPLFSKNAGKLDSGNSGNPVTSDPCQYFLFSTQVKNVQVWILLYTCASTRGVVLDVVHSMTSNTLIHSLRKFISRRDAPALIISCTRVDYIG